jgi:SAM-dependent methyltransferase
MNEAPPMSDSAVAAGESSPVPDYDRIASIYNAHFGEYSRRVVPVLERLVLASLPHSARILDVCCGTGHLAAALVERGFVVTGIDGSIEMLRIARQNAPEAEFLLSDVRLFRQSERFDAAVSTFDSINHIVEVSDLRATFVNVYRALRSGGRFVFDMNMDDGYRCRWGGEMRGSDNGRAFVIEATYSPESRLAWNVIRWLEADPDGPAPLTFTERCYTEEEVRSSLTEAGFHGIEVYDGHRDLGLPGEVGRSFFVCEKSRMSSSRGEPDLRENGSGSATEADVPQPMDASTADRHETTTPIRETPPAGRRRLRDLATCADDALWPGQPPAFQVGFGARRLLAIEEVLTTLPPEPYQHLKAVAADFEWFVPSDTVLGQVRPFRASVKCPTSEAPSIPWARIVYLSPLLEQQEWPVVVTVVVHELAHVILGHRLHDLDLESFERQEEAAWHAVREWGFGAEADRADEQLRDQALKRVSPDSHREIRPAARQTIK